MHGDWQTVEAVLSKTWPTAGEYLQTWKLKLSTTKAVLVVFHLNNKETKRELGNHNNVTLPFCPEPTYLEVTWDRTLTYCWHFESFRKKLTNITLCTPEVACWLWLGIWSNNVANSHLSPGPFSSRILCFCLVLQCSHLPHWPHHQRHLAKWDWMPAYLHTSGQSSYPHRHPTCWALSQWSHTVSSTPCHGAWTSSPLSVHLFIEWECTASQIEIPNCIRCTTTHQFIWR